jgi:hypothetical protein
MEEDIGVDDEAGDYSVRVSRDDTVSTLGGGAWEEHLDDRAKPKPANEVFFSNASQPYTASPSIYFPYLLQT